MIHVERDAADDNGVAVRPSAKWFARAADATQVALREGGQHEADRDVYADDVDVRAVLERLFADKCAYCESTIGVTGPWDVEHYRPKGRVAERDDHPGYYWLAYEWSNLLPSCEDCNRARRDKPRWGDARYGRSAGKADQFPLSDEATRCMTPNDSLTAEARLVLDPCRDDPENHLTFGVDGSIIAVAESPNGLASIDVFHLHRTRLQRARRGVVEFAIRQIRNSPEVRDALLRDLAASGMVYAGVARAMLRDPAAFGLPT